MSSLPPTALETILTQMTRLPLWVKQVLYSQMRSELEHTLSSETLDAFSADHILQLWVPELTKDGTRLMQERSPQVPNGIMRIMQLSRYHKNVANMVIANQWNLEQCSVYLREAVQQEWVVRPQSGIVLATIDYLAGATRLGEYLVKINRITSEQLDQALRTQKYIEESMGDRTGIADILINLGYISKVDSEGILFLKEESKKAFVGLAPVANQPAGPPGSQPR